MNILISHEKGKTHWLSLLSCLITFAVFLLAVVPDSHAENIKQKNFRSPEEAAAALVAAVKAHDLNDMLAILGSGSRELISSGDEASDRTGREKFLRAYNEMHTFSQKSADTMILSVGADSWPMPIPIVKKVSVWVFDTQKGRQEILDRRIGRNELHVMEVLHAYVDAQHEYATKDCGGSGKVEFAQRIMSAEGKHDGLYWAAKEGEEESPLGPLVAQAA
ncbi:MAG: DUF2950 domain-containing protein, partial [Thermodesulfovibrionales bacterium]|nr:DUF2950 domain-containing protein [Thermodesulfovibrionales bacterium]